jgi:hypothetical protein
MRPDHPAARTTRGDGFSVSEGRLAAGGAAPSRFQPNDGTRERRGEEAGFDSTATTAWIGFQAVAVIARVLVVVGLWLGLFLAVFLGYVTLPLIAPAVLGAGYLALQIGRKVLHSR